MSPPELLTQQSLVPRGESTSTGDPGVLSHWLSVRSWEGFGARYMWNNLKHLECCSGFLEDKTPLLTSVLGPYIT